ncbi:MAG TPA: GHMP kinase [Firmicutes bacterium]|nr:GHMP kinase [Bacillota bacterium]
MPSLERHLSGCRRGQASAPGSCGELVQGTIDGVDFLVTCPVNLYATAAVSVCRAARVQDSPDLRVRKRARKQKALAAALRVLELLEGPTPVPGISSLQRRLAIRSQLAIRITSELPSSKGMASSTADIAATCAATARALGREGLSPDEIANIALSVEPTDGIMFPGIVLFDHVRGTIRRSLGVAPPIDILIIDLGGHVDTVAFNRRDDLATLNRRKEPAVRDALALVEEGIRLGDAAMVGEGATLSAIAHQAILPKPELPALISMARRSGAVGVNIAHSGTVVGILIDRRQGNSHEIIERIERESRLRVYTRGAGFHCSPTSPCILGKVRLTDGGIFYEQLSGAVFHDRPS